MNFITFFRRGICLIFILLMNFTYILNANEKKIMFGHLSIKDGLSQSSVYCILQDSKGFIWFGTEDGLNKFNGYNFVVYRVDADNPNSLSHSWVLSFFMDRSGIFWIGTEHGLNRFDRENEQFTRYFHDPNNPNSLSNNRILSICEDHLGVLWVGTHSGLNKFIRKKEQFIRYLTDPNNSNSLSNNSIRSIYEDKSNILWIGTNGGGLNIFNREKEQFFHYKNVPDDPNSLSDNNVLSIYEDRSGVLWIGTEHGGLNQFDRSKKQFICYKNKVDDPNSLGDNHINVIYEDHEGVLWIGTNEEGLNMFDRKIKKFFRYKQNPIDPNSLGSNRVLSIYEDSTGGLWFGNYAGGINIFNRQTQKFIHYKTEPNNPNSLSYSDIRQVYEDHEGILWIGTDGEGLNKFDRKKGRFTHYKKDSDNPNSLSDNRIFTISEDRKGILWIGTYGGGLNKFDKKREKFVHYLSDPNNPHSLSDNRIRVIREDRSGKLWIGTDGGGLNKFDKKTEQFIHYTHDPDNPYSLGKNRIFCILEDHEGVLWIGTFGEGLDKFDQKNERFIHYKTDPDDPNSISNNYILSICEDKSNMIWIGTDGGLTKLDPIKNTCTLFTEKDGLPNNVIYDILEDDKGNLWMCSNKGLSKFNPKTKKFKNYDMKDGLQSNEFNTGTAFKSKSGEMFFGGVNGFNSFFPDRIIDNPHIPQVVITDFQLFNKPVPIGKTEDGRSILERSITETKRIKLLYRDNVFSFEFAALHFASPEKNMYAYMMEGFEKDWNYVGNRRFVTYTGLPPGDYTFRVKASNNDGVWNEEGTSIKIKIIPPFWKTTLFYAVCVLLILLSGVGIYRLRVRQLKTRKEELESLVKERTSQLAYSNKQLEDANKELEKLSIVARETDNAVLITDKEGNFIWVNEGFTRLYEVTFEQLIKKRGENIINSSTNPEIKDNINKCIKENRTVVYESFYIKETGKKIWTQTSLTPIFDNNGNLINLVAIDSDISKIKEAEEAAERANQSKSEFLARMSHEIRTPMNGIIGFTDMLLDTNLTDEQIEYARTIGKSGEALIAILNDILDFSKIEAGELTFDPIDFDPEITIFDICELILPRIQTKPIELLCRVGDNVPAYIKSDAGRFRQVIVNLMGNATKFTERGEIEISLDIDEEEKERLKLHVKVRDTGIGIAGDKIDNIFEVFQQADGSTTRKYGGTGLGLSICKQISNLLGGDVWVESKQGKGSIFHFTCWVEESKRESKKELLRDYLEGKRVLIVDDNPTNLEILSHSLEISKMHVVKVSKSREAIPIIQEYFENKNPFDVCIIDIQMPEFSGYDLAKEIRQLEPPMSSIPLLAFSSSTLSRSKKFKIAGFNGYLPKPIQRKKLLKMIERLLGLGSVKEEDTKDDIVTQHTIVEESKHSIRILLVEDNPINLKLARFMLEKAGYHITIAENGSEAVEIFSSDPDIYDLIIMDVQMPIMDGREATRLIRSKGFKDIPIIAMTAEAMKGDRERSLEAGMNDYIAKPIKRDVVFKIVKKWCLER